ncbi:glutamate-5-semialdehyde dehydrogenase [Curtobacterium flaccumfaciens pv. flaccumfaciens]|uniref:glutamate-5-semialdehyde dehydrogenase n=1 Tax=Curtobacterium flaccumfaciens TaxID=2035 RepID=UPI00265A4BC2|nr:glutamate-5-semialdehyde dehydrogenase [Curtobacterium flaccumfaciens]MCS5504190.1 glutamate-5-semialdehyde dehydrogenase [Curtobacterium flaccumfaciens pv. flaccumfaciens]MCS5510425.1 glutamate-5-semialdehyde dehydrogenase [Curtobacterium flaccumfaciens pv. flaccumfaciens]MCX2786843.1 glutamate-5-semialdehyde dehydrogenase [Curtobacterium flaccumfaciens pv. flaccumfaciens]
MSSIAPAPTLTDKLVAARAASSALATATTAVKDAALGAIAAAVRAATDEIVAANHDDLIAGEDGGLSSGLLDRLRLDPGRIEALAAAVEHVVGLTDPVGEHVRGSQLPNGLQLTQVRVPFGVVGAIYEARPNVTVDIASLALKSGNAVVLRGGSAAQHTNAVLVARIQDAVESVGLPRDLVQTIDEFGRAGATELMRARGLVDVLIPRGSAALIQTVVTESQVPVIETGAGVVHVFLDASAPEQRAVDIVLNSKVQRPSVCNALETLLVHEASAERLLPVLADRLRASGVTLRGDDATRAIVPGVLRATDDDWATESMDLDLSIRVVPDVDAAMAHIARWSTHHTESIVTNDVDTAERFLATVDSAVVMVNASTRFTDGGEFGFGAEVGISTQKLHARGPMGLPELTSTKWIVRGSGQIRG